MARRLVGAALVCAALLAGCRDSGPEGARFVLDGKIFVFNYRVATATYLVNIKASGPVADGLTAVASFENPAGGDPLVVREKIWPQTAKTTIHSPPVQCIVKDRPYAVSIRIEGPDGATRQTIETTVISSLDQDVLPDKPLVVGPLYTPNPELKGHPGGDIGESRCPAPAQAG